MILNYDKKFAYVHIPKCAGSMVKDQLAPIDQTEGRFQRIITNADFGNLHTAHLPLWLLKELYPEDFCSLKDSEAFTLVRNPWDRFPSAVSQRLKQFRGTDPFSLSTNEIQREVATIIDFLTNNPSNPTLEFSHFLRQRDFVYFEEEKIVKNVFRIENVKGMFETIAPITGQLYDHKYRANQKINFRYKFAKEPVLSINDWLRTRVPFTFYRPLKDVAKRMFARSSDDFANAVINSFDCVEFVNDFYKADFELYESG